MFFFLFFFFFFFFSSRRRHTRWPRDWSSDVCSSDLLRQTFPGIACLVMGSGEEEEHQQAEQLVAARGLQHSILFLGNVVHETCLSIISQVDLFVRPTLADGEIGRASW